MPITFSSSGLINIAIDIERMGVAFYDVMAKSTENAATRDVFQYLVDMEREHIQIFKEMLVESDKWQILETNAQNHAPYLKALADSAVFTDDMITSEKAARVDSDIEALELAIDAEKDSILFYHEMKEIMPQRAQATVNKIIDEEKSHLRQLSDLKKKLAAL